MPAKKQNTVTHIQKGECNRKRNAIKSYTKELARIQTQRSIELSRMKTIHLGISDILNAESLDTRTKQTLIKKLKCDLKNAKYRDAHHQNMTRHYTEKIHRTELQI